MNNQLTELKTHMEEAVYDANLASSKIKIEKLIKFFPGMLSYRVRHLLNNLCNRYDITYVDLGCFRGASMVCALYNNDTVIGYAVDNFQFDPLELKKPKEAATDKNWKYQHVINSLKENLKMGGSINQVTIIEKAANTLTAEDITLPIDVCYVDTETVTFRQDITAVLPLFNKYGIVVTARVRDKADELIEAAFTSTRTKIHHEITLKSNGLQDGKTWWSGVKIWLIEPSAELRRKVLVARANQMTREMQDDT